MFFSSFIDNYVMYSYLEDVTNEMYDWLKTLTIGRLRVYNFFYVYGRVIMEVNYGTLLLLFKQSSQQTLLKNMVQL